MISGLQYCLVRSGKESYFGITNLYSKGEERFIYFSVKSKKGKSNGTSNTVKLCQAHTLQAKQFAEASIFLPTIQEVMGWTKNIRQIEMVTIKFAHFHNFHSKFTCVRNYLPNRAHFSQILSLLYALFNGQKRYCIKINNKPMIIHFRSQFFNTINNGV